MAAPTRTPRTSWIEEGLRALGVGGPDAVRIETLAQALGVSTGGFYWHFDDRRALLEEMLDAWEHRPRGPRLGPTRQGGRQAPQARG
jgi:AcrR family transcriptional regulator